MCDIFYIMLTTYKLACVCKNCGTEYEFSLLLDDFRFDLIGSTEREMGYENVYRGVHCIYCENCENTANIYVFAYEYPDFECCHSEYEFYDVDAFDILDFDYVDIAEDYIMLLQAVELDDYEPPEPKPYSDCKSRKQKAVNQ